MLYSGSFVTNRVFHLVLLPFGVMQQVCHLGILAIRLSLFLVHALFLRFGRVCIPHTPYLLYLLMYITFERRRWCRYDIMGRRVRLARCFVLEGIDEVYDGTALFSEHGGGTKAFESIFFFISKLHPEFTCKAIEPGVYMYFLRWLADNCRISAIASQYALVLSLWGKSYVTWFKQSPTRQTCCTLCRAIGAARYGLSQRGRSMAGRRGHVICTKGREFGYACNHREQNRHLLNAISTRSAHILCP